ncbi:C-type lectin domain family 10 member A-like [Bufo gargarizans]|uniref:C-type lectin domain family 10 member A-like n=1 Tax=Bufo gargarizans TaxID=30331 RepID=UPI001CF0DA05|nr:C-type lectin domain family 10 member A-like [Bufo gargarizans]
MAEAVTYADLRFAEILQRERKPPETSPEEDRDNLEATYENVVKPQRKQEDPEVPPSGRGHLLLAGFRHWAPHSALLLLLLCLLLSAITIERTMKYLHVASDLQALAATHQAMNESLLMNLQSKEHILTTLQKDLKNTEERVKELTQGTQDLTSALERTKDQLQTEKNMKNEAQTKLERAEKTLREAQANLSQREKDICPENWILLGRKCLLITDEKRSWTECDEFCKSRDSNLIVVQWDDLTLKVFLSNKTEDSWVGKEFTYKENKQSWEWPKQYWKTSMYCWRFRTGDLAPEECTTRKLCVCEKNLVLMTIKKVSPNMYNENPQFTLWDTDYQCWRRW